MDIVDIGRMRNLVSRYGDRFLERIFTTSEVAYCFSHRDPFPHLAARFAAKEAFIKASDPLRGKINWKDIEVGRNESGAPFLLLKGKIVKKAMLSLSHTEGMASAVVFCKGIKKK